MDLLSPVVRHLTYDAYLRRDGYAVGAHRGALARSQYMSRDELTALQWSRLCAIIRHAAEKSAFYQDRFRRVGFHPRDLRSFDDLRGLPPLTKEDIRAGLSHSLSDGFTAETTTHKRTGGSTGVPLHVYIDFGAASQKRAAVERHDGWAGWRAGDPMAAVWGDTDKPQPWRMRLRNALTGRARYLDSLVFTEQKLAEFVAYLRRERPPLLFGHAHSVFRLAEYVESEGGPPIRFRGVITSAMTLSQGERAKIEDVFVSPVFNRYGCEELSLIASECDRHEGLHVFGEGVYLEFEEVAGPGSPARLLVTDLLNRAMPLIRYEIGDLSIPADGPCSCGRGLPLLREVSGRTADFLYTPEGKPVFGISILDTFVIHIPGIRQAQIVQDRMDHLLIRVVPDADYGDETVARLGSTVAEVFGARMNWDLVQDEEIELTLAGKYRFSICKIESRRGASLQRGLGHGG